MAMTNLFADSFNHTLMRNETCHCHETPVVIAPHQSPALRGTAGASFPQGKPNRCGGDGRRGTGSR